MLKLVVKRGCMVGLTVTINGFHLNFNPDPPEFGFILPEKTNQPLKKIMHILNKNQI